MDPLLLRHLDPRQALRPLEFVNSPRNPCSPIKPFTVTEYTQFTQSISTCSSFHGRSIASGQDARRSGALRDYYDVDNYSRALYQKD